MPGHSNNVGATAVVSHGAAGHEGVLFGRGRSFGSFGELAQGRLSDGRDFLVTLPIDMWSTCELICEPLVGPCVVDCELSKSKRVSEYMLAALGIEAGVAVRLRLTRNIPVGKGLSSSTADMLAVVRAFERAFGVITTPQFVSRLFAKVEPHEGLHYRACVAYDHRQGELLHHFDHIPSFCVIGIDAGGENATTDYNEGLSFPPGSLGQYDVLYRDLQAAFANRDDAEIARCARRSAQLHALRTKDDFLAELLERAPQPDVMGVIATHSGTCAGLLLPANTREARLREIEASVATLGRVFRTQTLKRLS